MARGWAPRPEGSGGEEQRRGASAARRLGAVAVLTCLVTALGLGETTCRAQELPGGWYESTLEEPAGEPATSRLAPGRLVVQSGVGLSIRLATDSNFRQETLAPAYIDVGATWLLRGDQPFLRTGPSLELSTNLSADGPAVRGVLPWRQWTLAPGWTFRLVPERSPVPRFVIELRPSILWVVAPQRTWGLSGTLGAALMLTASLGVYVEATASMVAGGATRDAVFTRHSFLSFDAGLRVDVERLP